MYADLQNLEKIISGEKTMDKIKEIIGEIIHEDYEGCEDFIKSGLLDSMDIVDLTEKLEEAYGIEISGRDIIPENYKNEQAIIELVRKYKGVQE